jgi:hypothetical protein
VNTPLTVAVGGHLTFAAGLTVQFASNTHLKVQGGTLTAVGTESAPVVLEGVTPVKGSWGGLTLVAGPNNAPTTATLTHAIVRHGGQEVGGFFVACLSLNTNSVFDVDVITVTNTRFEECDVYGVNTLGAGQNFAAFRDVAFVNCDVPLSMHPDTVGSLSSSITYVNGVSNQLRPGTVAHTQTWASQSIAWNMPGLVSVSTDTESPVLTIASGTLIEAGTAAAIYVGGEVPGFVGALQANGVTFASDGLGGPWEGIRFYPGASASTLNDITVSGTGGVSSDGDVDSAGVGIVGDGQGIVITNSTFSANARDVLLQCGASAVLTGNTATVVTGPGC